MELPGKAVSGVKQWIAPPAKYAPRLVEIAETNIPVGRGEASPSSKAGQEYLRLRRKVGGERFAKLEKTQQEAIKTVIRRTAADTAGMVDPVPVKKLIKRPDGSMREIEVDPEPSAVLKDAATKTFDNAKPMYEKLDEAAVTIPETFNNASRVTQQAIARAKKLGVVIADAPDASPLVDQSGQPIGVAPVAQQPLTTYMKVRSELLKMGRVTADPALRHTIGQEVEAMDANMKTALEGTDL